MLELVGSMASEPIDSEGWLSVIGVQFKPASIVFQTPPAAAPRKATSGFLGSTASAATRPELLGLPLKGNTPVATEPSGSVRSPRNHSSRPFRKSSSSGMASGDGAPFGPAVGGCSAGG